MILPLQVAGIAFPRTPLCQKTEAFAREVYTDDMVFNHHPRVYLWGSMIAKSQGMVFDEETFFLGAMLHNLGLAKRFYGPHRFEINGAHAAADFLRAAGAAPATIDTVWQAVAFHTSTGIAGHMKPEVALTHMGAGVDTLGINADQLPAEARDAVLKAFPSLGFKARFYSVIQDTVSANPAAAPFTWMADIAKEIVPGFAVPTFQQVMKGSILHE
jgi:hypothetical protein